MGPVRAESVTAFLVKIGNGPAVGKDNSLVAPFAAQYGVYQVVTSAAGLSAEAVVGNHDLLYIGFGNQVFEGGKVGFAKVPFAYFRVIAVPVPFRTGVHGKVLGTGVRFEDFCGRGPLQAADHGHAQGAGQVRVFPVGLHAAAPARVPENVDVGRPEGDALVPAHPAALQRLAILDAGLVTDGGKHLIHKGFVKRSRHGNGHGKHGGFSVAGHAVQGLVPPVVGGNAQRFHGLGIVHHQGGFFLDGKLGNQFLGALFRRLGAGRCKEQGGAGKLDGFHVI